MTKPHPLTARRIMVYGVTGSGKTTVAARLSARTGLPWHAVDELTWDAAWTPVDSGEQRRRIAAICAREEWILDHGYGSWLDLVMARADLVIGLDYPRWVSLGRLVRRCLVNVLTKRPTCNGNMETWRTMFSRESIIAWHFASFRRKHERIVAWQSDPSLPRVARFTSPAELTRWLRSIDPR